ncbi:NAD-dependent epimerase/dehydratase family protein [Stieleria varia]|uniref:3 beta-hydroxysteroid dehydrogenase/Delta 5-->4-isomerase n=1 Tax=Stieleria varia TaxID=2528005 RepID=A0A5C6AS20_9BACT|nr:NAD-dependent epimerase/dehydratase family protein [Stieleria varia]TWU00964.1 3 beta-hydroxysteroid dehydrogenase/Delta 5-->4-isomerase [Stieleria varia]
MSSDAAPIFVTGGTGFIGTRLVQTLIGQEYRVRVLTRRGPETADTSWLSHERIELVHGDITDVGSLIRGMQGCDRVLHLAAYAKNWAPSRDIYNQINVEGMRNVFAAAEQVGVRRVVWTSTIMTLGPSTPGKVGDERMPRSSNEFLTGYEESKWLAEQEAFRWTDRGFPVVIVNPTRVYGPGPLTEGNALAKLIDDYNRGRVPILFNRGVNVGNYVLVDDVVQGHLLALEKGRVGERYILGGTNVSLRDFFRAIDGVTGRTHWQIPTFKFGPLLLSHLMELRARWFGAYPLITPGWVRTFATDWAFSSDKAIEELGYRPTPLKDGLKLTCQWLQQMHGK